LHAEDPRISLRQIPVGILLRQNSAAAEYSS
jgi:hypothetical protein